MNIYDTLKLHNIDATGTSEGAKEAWKKRHRGISDKQQADREDKADKEDFKPRKTLKELHKIFTEAGRNSNTVLLTYHKEDGSPRKYSVEPYSYRGDKFFGYDRDEKTIKGFKLLRIVDAKVQPEFKFKPRWPVELKASAIGLTED